MYGQDTNTREIIIDEYGADLKRLLAYLPYLRKQQNSLKQNFYDGEGGQKVVPVPVYDSTLLAFVKLAKSTKFINRNYPYAYRHYKIETIEQEKEAMLKAKITDIDLFRGIMSKYVLGGMSKATLWTTAANEGIFVMALECLDKLINEHGATKYTPVV